MILMLYVDDLLLLGADKLLPNKLKKQLMDRSEITDMGDVSRVLGMNVARDRKKRTFIINYRDYKEDVIERFGMKSCNPAYIPDVGPELSLKQPEEKLLHEGDKTYYQSVTGAMLGQVSRYSIFLLLTSWRGQYPRV